MPTGTVRIHRVLRAKPERVYRAFLEADAIAKWLPPFGFTGGSNFRNYQGLLTGTGPYYEYDVYPTASGRGVERIVTDGLGYHYTGNHYASFTNF